VKEREKGKREENTYRGRERDSERKENRGMKERE